MSYTEYTVRVFESGDSYWYLNGKRLTESEVNARMSKSACDPSKSVVEIDGKKYKLSPIDS